MLVLVKDLACHPPAVHRVGSRVGSASLPAYSNIFPQRGDLAPQREFQSWLYSLFLANSPEPGQGLAVLCLLSLRSLSLPASPLFARSPLHSQRSALREALADLFCFAAQTC